MQLHARALKPCNAAAHVPPGADQRRKTGDRADGLPAAAAPLDRHALANGGWLRRRIFARQLLNVGRGNACDLRNAFRRIAGGARLQLLAFTSKLVDALLDLVLRGRLVFAGFVWVMWWLWVIRRSPSEADSLDG